MSGSQQGLVYANFELTCDCGTNVPMSFIGLREDTEILCPNCQANLSLDPDEYEDMAEQFEDAVIALFKKADLGHPSERIIRFIQHHNRAPTPDDLREPEGYAVNLVGEQNYQPAIAFCAVGQEVTLFREIGNPYDECAIVAISASGLPIGYVARDNFVQRVVHEQGEGCAASILNLPTGSRGFTEVVLDVRIGGEALATRPFRR